MEWINEKAKTLKQGAIRAMFDHLRMTGVIRHSNIGDGYEAVCEGGKGRDARQGHHALYAERRRFRQAVQKNPT